jgi:hypothetical protein
MLTIVNSFKAYQGNLKSISLEIVGYGQEGQGCGFSRHAVVRALFS